MRALCFLLLPLGLWGQKDAVRREIEAINKAYAQWTQMRTEIDYVMYATHTGTKEIDRQQAVVYRNGDALLYRMGPVETLTTATHSIAADHEDRELVLGPARNTLSENQFGLDLDMILDACDSLRLSDLGGGVKMIAMVVALPDLEKVELRFHAQTRMMQKVTLYYREKVEWETGKPPTKARMELIYKKQDTQPKFDKGLFSLERFVRRDGNKYYSAAAYNNYTLFNQTEVR